MSAPSQRARSLLADALEPFPQLSNSVAVLRYSTHPNPWKCWESVALGSIDAALRGDARGSAVHIAGPIGDAIRSAVDKARAEARP